MKQSQHLLSVSDLTKAEVENLFETAKMLEPILDRPLKRVPAFRRKTVVLAFFEPSTRTRVSFETAAKTLGANTTIITTEGSSVVKGETFVDTIQTLQSMDPDLLVIRHKSAGAALLAAKYCQCPVINAGDGTHEHPTQALTDLLTLYKALGGPFKKLKIGIAGDILHSRVARSNILLLKMFGGEIHLIGAASLIPIEFKAPEIHIHYSMGAALPELDVLMMLRIQQERLQENFFPSLSEYSEFYGLNMRRLKKAKPEILIMHPGPVNVGVEMTEDVMTHKNCLIEHQVRNGVLVRMALLYRMLSCKK